MQKNVLKHQFENFSITSNESLDKAYDRFQKLISQLEVHGALISKEDINQKFLISLPSSWNQIALIMRNKPYINEIDIDDLYNNLMVYEGELKRSLGYNSASQNLDFLSSENTSSTNEVSTASGDFEVSTTGGISQVPSTPCAHDVAMLTVKVKKLIQRTGINLDFKEKRPVSLDKTKIECYNCHREFPWLAIPYMRKLYSPLYPLKRKYEAHANEVHLSRQRYPDQIALVANSLSCLNSTQYYPQLSSATQQYYSPPAPQRSYDAPIVQQSHNPWSSLIPLSRGSFDVIVGMDWLSKKKFVIVCHEKVDSKSSPDRVSAHSHHTAVLFDVTLEGFPFHCEYLRVSPMNVLAEFHKVKFFLRETRMAGRVDAFASLGHDVSLQCQQSTL
ncbi:hypothetical protein Tco_1111953 [Tanacetum coccineum]|uniref:Uncharacterized protein n=1 Tax=Tanacetum coccineum TaxID=301880 RepID=A0ABQ5IPH1_9ASTR